MAQVVDIRKADDPRDVIHQAVHLLVEGELVAFPTETVYTIGAYALQTSAVQKLQELTMRESRSRQPIPFVVKGAQESLDYVPDMSPLGRKLARRCWPGPVIITFDVTAKDGLLSTLPRETRSAIVTANEIQFRVPAHDAIFEILKLLPAPLLVSPERSRPEDVLKAAGDVTDRYGDDVALIIDDGPCRYGEAASVIRVSADTWELVHAGVVNEKTFNWLASDIYLFICTGNTCRSPMAEGIFRKFLSERLQCSEDDLFDRGFVIASAGLATVNGAPASPESIEVVAKRGVDLRSHSSQPVTERLLEQADHIFTMTRGHLESVLAQRSEIAGQVEMLSREQTDIADPIGGGMDEYVECEREIERHVRAIVDAIEVQ